MNEAKTHVLLTAFHSILNIRIGYARIRPVECHIELRFPALLTARMDLSPREHFRFRDEYLLIKWINARSEHLSSNCDG